MKYRRLGRTDWQVSEIGYGMWGLVGWTGSDPAEVWQALERAVELGCNFFDTAWDYAEGKSEAILGRLVRAHPDMRLYTATKIPPKNQQWPSRREFTLDDCYPPDHIQKFVESSLKNAGLESFDLMQFHVWEDSWAEDDRWAKKLESLREQNLIGAVGISINRWEPWNGVRTVRSGNVDAVQVIYNIFDQNPEDELFPACRDMDVGVIARVPFDEGALTGSVRPQTTFPEGDFRNEYFSGERKREVWERVQRIAQDAAVPLDRLPELALRFCLSAPAVSTVIPGMRTPEHVAASAAVSELGPLPPATLEKLRPHRWVGSCYD